MIWKEVFDKIPKEYNKTSSIYNLKDMSISFVKKEEYLNNIDRNKNVIILSPKSKKIDGNINILEVRNENVEYVFGKIHNFLYKNSFPKENIISKEANISEHSLVGIHGNTYYDNIKNTDRINLYHIGNVIIEDGVDIEAYSIVHRAGIDSTILKRNVKVCVMCNVGHNCYIDENTILAPGVMLGGGTKVGKNCYLWQNTVTKSNISICDNVIIGANSFVNRDITKSGVYVGTPVKYIKEYNSKLR